MVSFFFFKSAGFEPIYMELSGGQFLPPVQTLVATSIFAKGENAYRVLSSAPKTGNPRQMLVDFTFSLFTLH